MSSHLEPYLTAVEDELRAIVSAPSPELGAFYSMMAYHLGWLDTDLRPVAAYSGKRIRPLLCLLACEAAGGDWHTALPAAAALELAHNFSLIHDDIEDHSPTRRGRPTLWRLWGLPQGINTGDGMLMLAFQALTRASSRGVDTVTVQTAIEILQSTILSLCHGQYLDVSFEGRLDVEEEDYLRMVAGKTASLLAASAQLGALFGGAGDKTEHYRQFGWNLGLAFQVVDDILGIWGDPAVTGKPAADDLLNRKMTLPVIFALRQGAEGRELAATYRQERLSDQDVSRALVSMERVGARDYAQNLAAHYEAAARVALQAAARPPAAEHLRALAASLTGRQR